jgi:hypothetical protein
MRAKYPLPKVVVVAKMIVILTTIVTAPARVVPSKATSAQEALDAKNLKPHRACSQYKALKAFNPH